MSLNKLIALALIAMFTLLDNTAPAQSSESAEVDKRGNLGLETVTIPSNVSQGFVRLSPKVLLYRPLTTKDTISPLVIFLHGSGGARRPIERTKWTGDVKAFVSTRPGLPNAYVLVPQSKGLWDPASLDKMLDYILESNPGIDANRVYCVGYSMGGKGTWEWAMASPDRFAAIIPKAFIPDLSKLGAMVDLPIWAMVGTKDSKPRSQGIPAMEKALKGLGSKVVKITIFEGANHATTSGKAKQLDGVYEWMFSHRLPRPTKPDSSAR